MRILRQRRGGLDTTYPTRLFQPLIQRARRHIQIPRRLGWVPSLHTNQIHRLLPELTRVMLVASDLHTGSLATGNSTAAGLSGAHALFGEYHLEFDRPGLCFVALFLRVTPFRNSL